MLEPTPVKELGKHRVTDMALGPTHSAILVETGAVYTFGRNSEGQLCSGNTQPSNIPVMVKSLLPKAWVSDYIARVGGGTEGVKSAHNGKVGD